MLPFLGFSDGNQLVFQGNIGPYFYSLFYVILKIIIVQWDPNANRRKYIYNKW